MRFKEKGFTLVELLVVVAIITLLATIAAGNYLTSIRRGRNAREIADLKKIQAGFEQYYTANLDYTDNCDIIYNDTEYFPGGKPTDHKGVAYASSCTNDTYCVCAELEEVGGEYPGANAHDDSCLFIAADPADHFCVTNLQ